MKETSCQKWSSVLHFDVGRADRRPAGLSFSTRRRSVLGVPARLRVGVKGGLKCHEGNERQSIETMTIL